MTNNNSVVDMHKNKEAGFGVLEILLVLIILALLGVLGWLFYKSNHKAASATTTNQVTTGPYAGWKSYTSPAEKFTFKYPSDWTINTDTFGAGENVNEAVYLTGPNNFHLSYTIAKIIPETATPANHAKSDSGPYAYDPNSNVYQGATALRVHGLNKLLYIVVDQSTINGNQPVQSLGIAENKAYIDQAYINPLYYLAKNAIGYEVQWNGSYAQPRGGPVVLTFNDFVVKPEVVKAKLILQSIAY